MIWHLVLFLLLLPHALGAATPGVGQASLCFVLVISVLYTAFENLRHQTLLKFCVGPLACIAILVNLEGPEQWTLHAAMVILPMALSPSA